MPDQGFTEQDTLGPAVALLSAMAPESDATALADLLWLAAHMNGGQEDPSAVLPAEQAADSSGEHDHEAPDDNRRLADEGRALHERLDGASGRVRGGPLAAARASGLPRALEMSRALRPWKRPWSQGRHPDLDIEATVENYARSGELLPVFTPAPERWFDLVLVLDCSPTMEVWQETIADFIAVLDRLGAFRTLTVRYLEFGDQGPEIHDRQGQVMSAGQLKAPDGRRLVVTVSDCAAPAWRQSEVWRQMYVWASSTPVALLNPLPAKLWRRTGLDLPTVRVLNDVPGSASPRWCFDLPSLLPPVESGDARGDWLPIPVLSMSPHSLDRWSRTLMRADPEGCGSVLIPRGGRTEGRMRRRSDALLAEGFLRTASAPAARLAVLCSTFDRLSIRLLHLIRQEMLPESDVADVAELLTSGLFSLEADEPGKVELSLSEAAQHRLRKDLSRHEVWQINRALSRYMETQGNGNGQLLAVAQDPDSVTDMTAEIQAFGRAFKRTLELLGLPADDTDDTAEHDERHGRAAVSAHPALSPSVSEAWSDWDRVPDDQPYFFLSYARTPPSRTRGSDPDLWVHTLYADLCEHIMHLTDLPAGAQAGFMDREMRFGDNWPEKLSENLATCRVFVPLFSPRYFGSEMCGREWYAFNERIVRARALSGRTFPAIVPALWTHVDLDQLPDSVRHIHVDHSAFGARYADEGIYGLIKLSRMRDEYEETVLRLAQRIVRVASESPLPPGQPRSYETTPSAFRPRGHGPRRIQLIVAAPTRGTIPPHREPATYGETAQDWNPYHRECTSPLPSIAEEMIRSLDYRVGLASFDDVAVWEGSNTSPTESWPQILLVDRWVLADGERRSRLMKFARAAPPWTILIFPASHSDAQPEEDEARALIPELEKTVQTLSRSRWTEHQLPVDRIPTLKAFADVLPAVVAHVTQQYVRHHSTPRPAEPTPPGLLDPPQGL